MNAINSKKIILIRHAESQNNVAKNNVRSAWNSIKKLEFSLPTKEQLLSTTSILKVEMNSELSQDGKNMVINLHKKIIKTDFIVNNKVELIVHSNLIRAKNTCNGIFHDSSKYFLKLLLFIFIYIIINYFYFI
jgi:bisphosphoglycerate-dependent phosphoglycerate mutase